MSMTVLPKPTVFVETREIGNGEFEMAWYVLIISMAKLGWMVRYDSNKAS